jgi:hypothetical protein
MHLSENVLLLRVWIGYRPLEANADKHRPPAISGHQQARSECSNCWATVLAGTNHRTAEAAIMLG